jgi:small conductance mechanosensitive channel
MFRTIALTLLFGLCVLGSTAAQQKAAEEPRRTETKQTTTPDKPASANAGQEKLSEAERIARLQRTIEENERLLAERKEKRAKFDDPGSEYSKAQAEFTQFDKELEAKRKELQKLKDAGQSEQAAALQSEIDSLQQRWKLARERFDIAIQERKTFQEQVATLEQRIAQDRDALNKLLAPPSTQPTMPPGQPPTTTPAQPGAAPGAQPGPAEPAAQPPVQPGAAPGEGAPAPPGAAPPGGEPAEPPSEEVQQAQQEAQAKAAKAEEAERAVASIRQKIETLRKQIEGEKEELANLRAKAENADETRRTLADLVQKRSAEGAPRDELNELWTKISEARQRSRNAQAEVNEKVDRIDQLQEQLQVAQAEHIAALEQAEQAREEADKAQEEYEQLQNPYAPRNVLKWLLKHGPKIAGILIGMALLLWFSRIAESRIVQFLVGRGGPGTQLDRENRAKTLMGVFHHAATLLIIVGGFFMIVREFGFDIVPLLGAAGVVGLAVAFGAQNLVRDYFSGFIILLENQYGINDVVKIAGVAGLVERITLRVTVLRDLEGVVHFVPNGQIDKASNMTHGWSRALFDIGVAYKEDVDQVMEILVQLGKEMRDDPDYGHLILDDPEMLGVDKFGDSAVVIKFFIKTRPLQQWTVKRQLLRRIKKRFDEVGIEIPFPHHTIYYGQPKETPIEQEVEGVEQTR